MRKGTPPERVTILRNAVSAALATPAIRSKLESEGRNVRQPINSQSQADEVFQQQYARLNQLIQAVGRKALA
ncbi:Tripartite tricarboxylate transporter family receptor [compost metagenome]